MGLGHARTYLKGYLMAIEKTFIMIKPDAVRDRKIGEIVARIERSGLVIERMEMTTLERATVEEHYAHLADKPFFGGRAVRSSRWAFPVSPLLLRCAPSWALLIRLTLLLVPSAATSLSMSTPT